VVDVTIEVVITVAVTIEVATIEDQEKIEKKINSF
jgi:hypothetical protein